MTEHARHLVAANPAATRVTVFDSALGWMAASWREGRLGALTFGHATRALAVRALGPDAGTSVLVAAEDDPLAGRLQAYAQGARDDFRDLPLVWTGTAFTQRVLRRCRQIGYGQTLTYAELAAAVGSPGAARAVGNVMSHNRLPLVIPCHRVVGCGGSLGGYSAPGGIRVKQRLLELEGARP